MSTTAKEYWESWLADMKDLGTELPVNLDNDKVVAFLKITFLDGLTTGISSAVHAEQMLLLRKIARKAGVEL